LPLRIIYFFLLILFTISNVAAQESATFRFSRQDGLPSNTIYDVYQSENGFVWIATQNGIARFNGYSFKTFSFANAKSRAVSNLTEDAYGRIWFKSFFGDIFYIENDSLQLFEPWNKLNQKGFPTIKFLGDTLSIICNSGLYLYSFSQSKFIKKISGTQYFDAEGLSMIYHDDKRQIVNSLNPNNTINSSYAIPGLTKAKVFSKSWFFGSEQRKLYQVTEKNTLKEITKNFLNPLKGCRDIIEIKKNLIAFIGIDGVYLIDLRGREGNHILKGENVSSITAIKEGGYIIGTLNNGLVYLPSINSKVLDGQYLNINLNKKNSSLIVGDFNGGISILDKQLKLIKSIPIQFKREVQSLYLNSAKQEILYYTNSLYKYKIQKNSLIRKNGIRSAKQIISIKDKYFIASSNGLQIITKNEDIKNYLEGVRCTSLAYDSINKQIWIGSQLGLHYINIRNDNEPVHFKIEDFNQEFGVSCLAIQNQGLLIGTPSKGLISVDLKSNRLIENITDLNGLPSNDITSLRANTNQKFIGTDKGLSIIDQNRSVNYLNKTKGLIAEEIYDLAVEVDYLWIIHDKGIQKISREIKKNSQKPLLIIDEILIDGNPRYANPSSNTLEIKPEEHQINVLFDVGNNIKSLGNTIIKYRIKELNDEKWNISSLKNPAANYLGLSPGNYQLEAYALNEDGFQSDMISLSLKVIAPFYKKPWFIIILTALVCFIIGILFYIRNQSKNRQQQTRLLLKSKEQALQLAQLTSIRSQINPHFIFNTMSLIQGKILNGLPDLAAKVIQDFSLLMRRILEFSQIETVSLTAELEVISHYLSIEKERSQGLLTYEINIESGLDTCMYNVPSLVTQPFVENAIKHGLMHKKGEKKIIISCSMIDHNLIIRIEDNGIGRKASQVLQKKRIKKHQSFALEAYEKRFELFNSLRAEKVRYTIDDLYNEKGIPKGTAVIITIIYEVYENK